MNKEGINNNSNTETLEKQEQTPVAVESKESGQEFAEKILAKIKEYMNSFLSKKEAIEKIEGVVSFDDPTIMEQIRNEINLDSQMDEIDNEVAKVQTETSENVNLTVSNFSKAYHHPDYRDKIAKQIVEARNSGQDAEVIRSDFYDKTAIEKENFESQEKERSVAEIMKEKDMVIVHGIPLLNNSKMDNNTVVNSSKMNFEESCELIIGLEPTLSTSIPSPDRANNGLAYKQGVILGEGKVLSANASDAGSVALNIKKRIPKYVDSAIQSNINIEEIVPLDGQGKPWNELTVENPKIAGLFIDMSFSEKDFDPNGPGFENYKNQGYNTQEIEKMAEEQKENYISSQDRMLIEMKNKSEKLVTPLYVFKNEEGKLNKYKVEFTESRYNDEYLRLKKYGFDDDMIPDEKKELVWSYNLIPVTAEDIYNTKPEISEERRKNMAQDLRNKNILS